MAKFTAGRQRLRLNVYVLAWHAEGPVVLLSAAGEVMGGA